MTCQTKAGYKTITDLIIQSVEYQSDDVVVFCYSTVVVPSKRSLHKALGSGLELGTCDVSNYCDHRS